MPLPPIVLHDRLGFRDFGVQPFHTRDISRAICGPIWRAGPPCPPRSATPLFTARQPACIGSQDAGLPNVYRKIQAAPCGGDECSLGRHHAEHLLPCFLLQYEKLKLHSSETYYRIRIHQATDCTGLPLPQITNVLIKFVQVRLCRVMS